MGEERHAPLSRQKLLLPPLRLVHLAHERLPPRSNHVDELGGVNCNFVPLRCCLRHQRSLLSLDARDALSQVRLSLSHGIGLAAQPRLVLADHIAQQVIFVAQVVLDCAVEADGCVAGRAVQVQLFRV